MADWRQDGIHVLLGLTLTLVFLGVVTAVGGWFILLLSVFAPSILQQAIENAGKLIHAGILTIALLEIVAWYILPRVGFVRQRLARRMTVAMAAIALFMMASLVFSQ